MIIRIKRKGATSYSTDCCLTLGGEEQQHFTLYGALGACAQDSFIESHLEVLHTCQWLPKNEQCPSANPSQFPPLRASRGREFSGHTTRAVSLVICLRDLYGVTQGYKNLFKVNKLRFSHLQQWGMSTARNAMIIKIGGKKKPSFTSGDARCKPPALPHVCV